MTEPSAPGGGVRSVRVAVEVVAGLLPGTPDPEHTRRFFIYSDEWYGVDRMKQLERLGVVNGQAQGYAMLLMLQPDRHNWVRTDWLWM